MALRVLIRRPHERGEGAEWDERGAARESGEGQQGWAETHARRAVVEKGAIGFVDWHRGRPSAVDQWPAGHRGTSPWPVPGAVLPSCLSPFGYPVPMRILLAVVGPDAGMG